MNSRAIFQKRLSLAVKEATEEVAEEAREHHRYTSRTGNLERAIDTSYGSEGLIGYAFLNTGTAPYGPFVHEGTKPHDIFPRGRKALRWVGKGGSSFIFAKRVHHPGSKEDQFLFDALDRKREAIHAIFSRQVGNSLDEVVADMEAGARKTTLRINL